MQSLPRSAMRHAHQEVERDASAKRLPLGRVACNKPDPARYLVCHSSNLPGFTGASGKAGAV